MSGGDPGLPESTLFEGLGFAPVEGKFVVVSLGSSGVTGVDGEGFGGIVITTTFVVMISGGRIGGGGSLMLGVTSK